MTDTTRWDKSLTSLVATFLAKSSRRPLKIVSGVLLPSPNHSKKGLRTQISHLSQGILFGKSSPARSQWDGEREEGGKGLSKSMDTEKYASRLQNLEEAQLEFPNKIMAL